MKKTLIRKIRRHGYFAALLLLGCIAVRAAEVAAPANNDPFYAVVWQIDEFNQSCPWQVSPYPNLTQFYWLTQNDTDDSRSGRNPVANLKAAAERLKKATDQMPEGRRAAFDWDNSHLLWSHPDDRVPVAGGEPFVLWWDNGAKRVGERMDQFFKAYRDIGGKLDIFVLDFEHGVGGTGVGGGQERISLAVQKRVEAVRDTPRFQEMMKAIRVEDPAYFYDPKFYPNAKWMAYARDLTRCYVNQAYYKPIRKYFPHVKFSNYGDYCDDFSTPQPNGAPRDAGEDIPGRYGGYAGTHQATDGLYGHLGGIVMEWGVPVEGKKVAATPFNAFQLHVNLMRTAVLSDPAPVTPWIAWRRYILDPAKPKGASVGETDYYQELIYHIALCNPDYFIFWSAFRWKPEMKAEDSCMKPDVQFVNDLIDEINGLAGFSGRKTLVDRLAPWHQGYLLSGMKTGGRNLWRLTPDLSVVKSVESCRVSEDPLRFEIAGRRIEFPGGNLIHLTKPMSAYGFWIETPDGTSPVLTASRAISP